MTDNDTLRPEDFEPHRVEPEKRVNKTTFSQVVRDQPLMRLAVILLPIIAVVILVIGVFGSSKAPVAPSSVTNGSQLSNAPGGQTTPNYKKAVDDVNKQNLESAVAEGKSTIPTPTSQSTSIREAPVDPLLEFRQVATPQATPQAQPVQAQPAQPTGYVAPQPVQQKPQVDPQMVQAISAEMRNILSGMTAAHISVTHVSSVEEKGDMVEAAATPAQVGGKEERAEGRVLITAGTVNYGELLTEANSDVPAPILVSVLSGPLAGARAIGTFKKTNDFLVLAFGTIVKNKKEYKVNALAIDPETTLAGLETSTDHHYFERFVLPAAAGFISGVGNYAQQAGSTVTYSTYGVSQSYPPLSTHNELLAGVGQGANAIAGAIQQGANVQPTIHVATGTPIGIMFLNAVRDQE